MKVHNDYNTIPDWDVKEKKQKTLMKLAESKEQAMGVVMVTAEGDFLQLFQ